MLDSLLQEYRGSQLMPMAWTSDRNAGFCNNITTPWMPMNVLSESNFSINVEKRQAMVQRVQELTSFRRHNLTPDPEEKRGNYLFHYINDGQIVMERYFERRKRLEEALQDNGSNKKKRSATYSASAFSSSETSRKEKNKKNEGEERTGEAIEQEVKETAIESDPHPHPRKKEVKQRSIKEIGRKSLDSHKRSLTKARFEASLKEVSLQPDTPITPAINSMIPRQLEEEANETQVLPSALKLVGRQSSSFVSRSRFVLFANLGQTARVKDLRDKFHSGSIKVTSNPKRIRDFLYFRSLKLDPGEAIIAQVE